MRGMELTGILVNVETGKASVHTIVDSLENLQKAIGCDCIDITSRLIAGKRFEIICDDEGAIKTNPKVSAVFQNGAPAFYGNLFICGHDGPELESLSEADCKHIQRNTMFVFYNDGQVNVAVKNVWW